EVARALAIDGLLDAVAVAIVDQRDVGSGCPRTLSEAVLAVVVVGAEELLRVESCWLRDRSITGVAVVVVLVAVEAIVGIVAESLVGDARERTTAREAVADVVVAVGDGAVLAVLDRTGDRLGLQPAEAVVGVPGGAMVELFHPGALA